MLKVNPLNLDWRNNIFVVERKEISHSTYAKYIHRIGSGTANFPQCNGSPNCRSGL